MGLITGSGGGGVVDVSRLTPAFEWNGVDLTQFRSGDTPDFSELGGAAARLSVVAGPTGAGNVLRVNSMLAGGDAHATWLVGTPLTFPDDPRRDLLFELDIEDSVASPNGSYFGVAFMADISGGAFDYHGAHHLFWGSAGWASRAEAGGLFTSNSFPAGVGTRGSRFQVEVRARKAPATPPFCRSYIRGQSSSGGQFGDARGLGFTTDLGALVPYSTGGALGATWDGLECRSIGLSAQSTAAAQLPDLDILGFRVYFL